MSLKFLRPAICDFLPSSRYDENKICNFHLKAPVSHGDNSQHARGRRSGLSNKAFLIGKRKKTQVHGLVARNTRPAIAKCVLAPSIFLIFSRSLYGAKPFFHRRMGRSRWVCWGGCLPEGVVLQGPLGGYAVEWATKVHNSSFGAPFQHSGFRTGGAIALT